MALHLGHIQYSQRQICKYFCWFSAAIQLTPDHSNLFSISLEGWSYRESTVFVPLKGTPTWPLFTKLYYKLGYNAFPNISHM